MSLKNKLTDKVTAVIGSWTFVICQLVFCSVWMIVNSFINTPWDPYPFSSLANMIQIQGALAASFILIASNRQQEIDSKRIEKDLELSDHMSKEIDELKK